jgi:uncharacterized protein
MTSTCEKNSHRLGAAVMAMALTTVGGASAAGCSSGPPPPVQAKPYEAEVLAHRQSKDEVFRTDIENSPIPPGERASFPGLVYFPVDPAYHVPASLAEDRSGPPVIIELMTSKNTVDRMTLVGTLTFRLATGVYRLAAFATAEEGLRRLFVPFGDLTNRTETYGGGRYLNLDRTATGVYDLDFNLAYHPYCVYNIEYTCPIPPPENRLQVAIRAGERMQQEGGVSGKAAH